MATARDKQAWAAYPPARHLRAVMRLWPNFRDALDRLRDQHARGGAPFDWPGDCYVPAVAAYAIYGDQHPDFLRAARGGELPLSEIDRPMTLAGAYTWSAGKICCRYDADLYAELTAQPLDGKLPMELFNRFPAWAVYVELPGVEFDGEIMDGVMAYVDWRVDLLRYELQLMLYRRGQDWPRCIALPFADTLDAALDLLYAEDGQNGARATQDPHNYRAEYVRIINLLIYLCADDADMPRPSHERTGHRPAPDIPERWDIGYRIGAAIRRYRNTEPEQTGAEPGTHRSPRPHMRRAHWHHFWTGSRAGERRLVLRWLPPVPVRINLGEELPVVVRPVRN